MRKIYASTYMLLLFQSVDVNLDFRPLSTMRAWKTTEQDRHEMVTISKPGLRATESQDKCFYIPIEPFTPKIPPSLYFIHY